LVLQLPPRTFEGVIQGKVDIGVAFVGVRRMRDDDFLACGSVKWMWIS
jgi:hypothetical protein